MFFGGIKKPLRECGHALPGFGQVPVSNPGLEPGAPGVCRPRASPLGDGAPFWLHHSSLESPSASTLALLASLQTRSASSRWLEPTKKNLRFLTHTGALGTKMDGNESHGRRASFQMGLPLSKYPPKSQQISFR